MLRQFLVGIAVSLGNIAIHATVMAAVLWVVAHRGCARHVASLASTGRCHDCDRIGPDGGAYR